MATPAQKLETAIDQITDRIVEVTAQIACDQNLDGESESLGTYLTQLQQSLDGLVALRAKLAGPYMVRSRGRAV